MKVSIKQQGLLKVIDIDSRSLYPSAYMSYHSEPENIQKMKECSVKLFMFPVYSGDEGINLESGLRPLRYRTMIITAPCGIWWFDMFGGWFRDERMETIIGKTQELMQNQTHDYLASDLQMENFPADAYKLYIFVANTYPQLVLPVWKFA